jgi:shikimate dehydrogenase
VRPLPGRLVLLGHPVAHSLSPRFQNAALRAAGLPLEYEVLDVPPARLAPTLADLRAIGAAGNVTIPHKEALASLCDELTDLARRVGAVNTFWCANGMLIGDNTDVAGFAAAVAALLGRDRLARLKSVAVLGAGGAAAAVLAAVECWPGARARVHGRSPDRARRLCERFGGVATAAATIDEAVTAADLVVNATPVGLGDDSVPMDPARLGSHTAVLDLVYRHGGTAFVRAADRLGLRAADGTSMLVEQGAVAFERWFGVVADRQAMWEALPR